MEDGNNYQFRKNIDYTEFFCEVSRCRKGILFQTEEGDTLNLKSEFSRFVFAAMAADSRLLLNGSIRCESFEDAQRLESYICKIG